MRHLVILAIVAICSISLLFMPSTAFSQEVAFQHQICSSDLREACHTSTGGTHVPTGDQIIAEYFTNSTGNWVLRSILFENGTVGNPTLELDGEAGNPAPSAVITTDGIDVHAQFVQQIDLTNYDGEDLFVQFDFRATATGDDVGKRTNNIYFAIYGHDDTDGNDINICNKSASRTST